MPSEVTAEQLRLVVDRLGDGLILFDREGICLYLNPEAVRIVGKTPSEVVGKHIREAVPDAMSRVVEGARDRLIAGEEVLVVPSYFTQGRWFEILGRPLGGDFIVHFHDITERLEAESARRQIEERFQILVNGVRDYCIVMLDPKGLIATWNVGATRMSGLSAEEAMGKPYSALYSPELAATGELRRKLELAVSQGSYTTESWFVRKDGSRFLARATYTALFDDLGSPSGFAIVAHDVTEQRKLEETVRTDEERLRLATVAGAVGTWEEIVDEGRFIADDQFLTISGLPTHKQAAFEDVLSKVHPDDREYVERGRRTVLDVPGEHEFELEYRVGGKTNGDVRWVECHGRTFEAADEPGRRVIGVLQDTTKRHRTDEFRNLAAGLIAHDLRSPLSAIKLSTHLLIEHDGLPAKARRRVETIVQKVDAMVKLVEQLLLYSQVQFGGGLPLNRELTDLEEVCRDAISDVEASRPDAQFELKAEGDVTGIWDKTRLTEAVSNLVGNAVKHGEPGQPIFVVARDRGDEVVLSVHNLGRPIPAELLPVLFEPFRREKKRLRPGESSFGLGLYIVRESVAAHGGTVEVSSSAAAGTTFTIQLPRAAAHPAPRSDASPHA
jgi:PAS domain S-box-containing protein